MAVEIPDKIRKALEEPQFWHLATVNPDGSPQVSTVWVGPKDDKILINTALGRKKPRNLERNPNVALSWVDPENGYHSASIQGRVVELRWRHTSEAAATAAMSSGSVCAASTRARAWPYTWQLTRMLRFATGWMAQAPFCASRFSTRSSSRPAIR